MRQACCADYSVLSCGQSPEVDVTSSCPAGVFVARCWHRGCSDFGTSAVRESTDKGLPLAVNLPLGQREHRNDVNPAGKRLSGLRQRRVAS